MSFQGLEEFVFKVRVLSTCFNFCSSSLLSSVTSVFKALVPPKTSELCICLRIKLRVSILCFTSQIKADLYLLIVPVRIFVWLAFVTESEKCYTAASMPLQIVIWYVYRYSSTVMVNAANASLL